MPRYALDTVVRSLALIVALVAVIDSTCPAAWGPFQQFMYVHQYACARNYSHARLQCMLCNADLASVHSSQENDYLLTKLQQQGQAAGRPVYLGMLKSTVDSRFFWPDGTQVRYTNWDQDEPNNAGGNERCVLLSSGSGFWNDIRCDYAYGFICKYPKEVRVTPQVSQTGCPEGYALYDGKCFKPHHNPTSYSLAEKSCAVDGAQLASSRDVDFITHYFPRDWRNQLNGRKWIKWHSNRHRRRSSRHLAGLMKIAYSIDDSGAVAPDPVSQQRPFVCMKPYSDEPRPQVCPSPDYVVMDNLCYYMDTGKKHSWPDAEYMCSLKGGSLVSIMTEEENERLLHLINRYWPSTRAYLWVGLVHARDGTLLWSDGTPVRHRNWEPGNSPDNAKRESMKKCAKMNADRGSWRLVNCYEEMQFMCKAYLREVDISVSSTPVVAKTTLPITASTLDVMNPSTDVRVSSTDVTVSSTDVTVSTNDIKASSTGATLPTFPTIGPTLVLPGKATKVQQTSKILQKEIRCGCSLTLHPVTNDTQDSVPMITLVVLKNQIKDNLNLMKMNNTSIELTDRNAFNTCERSAAAEGQLCACVCPRAMGSALAGKGGNYVHWMGAFGGHYMTTLQQMLCATVRDEIPPPGRVVGVAEQSNGNNEGVRNKAGNTVGLQAASATERKQSAEKVLPAFRLCCSVVHQPYGPMFVWNEGCLNH